MERTNIRVGHGPPIDDDCIWLSGSTEGAVVQEESDNGDESDEDTLSEDYHLLSQEFLQRRALLVKHLHIFCQKGAIQARYTPSCQ
jgi:hypothetical protein